ncbi:MAG: fluoride efflux transporter CrcB [Rhizonema sp. NSF051]|nr:fluoride efflux transporter CrcB [Rhizonema sp. NSF051]
MRFNLKKLSRKLLDHRKRMLALVPKLVPEVLQSPTFRTPVAICFGACAGALSRYYVSLWFAQCFSASFPYGTLFINLTGCFTMGFFTTLVLERVANIEPEVRVLFAIGFLVSYTTFSTFGIDTLTLLRNRSWMAAGFYWGVSAVVGVICVQLGVILARLTK